MDLQLNNNTDSRLSRTIHSPLLNLVIAASILSKITQGKSYLQSPWTPFRPIFGYYPHQALPSIWYPIDPFVFPSRIYPSLTTNVPQLQAPPVNQQQIIHIHEAPQLTAEEDTTDNTQFFQQFPQVGDTDATNLKEHIALNEQNSTDELNFLDEASNDLIPEDNFEEAASNIDEVYEKIKLSYDGNNTFPPIINLLLENENSTNNEIPEPSTPYGKPVNDSEKEAINESTTTSFESTNYDEAVLTTTEKIPNCLLASATNDLEMAEASIYRRRTPAPVYDDYYEDYSNRNVLKQKSTRRTTRRPASRINSKRRPVTTPYYEDEYYRTTPRNRRRTTTKPRRTTPSYEDYEYDRFYNNRRQPVRNPIRRATTPQDEYYEENYDDEYDYVRQRPNFRPRQQESTTTSEETTTTSGTTTTTEGTTKTTETSTQTSTSTTVGYPYNGSNVHGNVSITYGPPNQNYHPGYGPSNGNEQVSITYGPPTGSNVVPFLDQWYNQYAKTSVLKRIQELLTPNNYYSPQYDADKYNYNYNDSSF